MSHRISTRQAFFVWFLIGTAFAALLQFAQTRAMGGTAEGLLFLGAVESAHQLVLEELPEAPVSPGMGHDGQLFYALALDLKGESVPDVIGSAGYRYRRILFPLLASGFGVLEGQGLLWGMIVTSALSMGLAAGAVAGLSRSLRLPGWTPLAVLFNPGMWLSVRLLTSDGPAFALALLAVWAFTRRRYGLTVIGLALAALTKEPYLAFAAGLAGFAWFAGTRDLATRVAVLPLVSVGLWWTYIAVVIGNPLTSGSQTVLPLSGLVGAVEHWPDLAARDIFYLIAMGTGFLLAVYVLARRWDMWGWLIAPWIPIAAIAAEAVWQFGNNAIRAFAPVLTLSILGFAARRLSSDQHRLTTPVETTPAV